jgi:uncharacterized protein
VNVARLKIIGVEEHGWTAGIRDALASLPEDRRDPSVSYFNTDETDKRLLDYCDARLRDMDAMGMDMAVLSISTPGTQILDAPEAVKLAREANDELAAAVARHPDRLQAFATLPTPDPVAAVDELHRAVLDLGLRGAMIHGRTGDKMLDHPDFAPMLEEASRLGTPIYIHPQFPSTAIRDIYYDGLPDELSTRLAAGMWGWHMETAINALRLILSGTFERAPDLQIILGHWGEMIPLFLERVDVAPTANYLPKSASEYFREHFYIAPSGIWSWQMLTHALTEVSADRILFAIDYPFQHSFDGYARHFLEQAPISPADKEKIGHLNAERLFGLYPAE